MTRDAERELLAAGARHFNLALDSAEVEALLRLADELETANAQFNLTAIRDRPGMLRKHVLDSLSLQPYSARPRIADVGTGAGFPGLPLAIVKSAAPLLADRGDRQEGALRGANRANAWAASTSRWCMRGPKLSACQALRHRGGARPVLVGRFRGLCRSFVRAGRRLLAMKGKRPDRGDCGAAASRSGYRGRASGRTAGAGRRAAYCGTLAGQARIARPKP